MDLKFYKRKVISYVSGGEPDSDPGVLRQFCPIFLAFSKEAEVSAHRGISCGVVLSGLIIPFVACTIFTVVSVAPVTETIFPADVVTILAIPTLF